MVCRASKEDYEALGQHDRLVTPTETAFHVGHTGSTTT
jgi:hypothetical protein